MTTISAPTIDPHAHDLEQRVLRFLLHRHLTLGSRLHIEADRGVVTLSGHVGSFHQRQLIHTFARRVAGVVQVIDRLEVDLPVLSADPHSDAPGLPIAVA